MEILATLSHALVYETASNPDLVSTQEVSWEMKNLSLKTISGQTAIQLLSLSCGIAILTLSEITAAADLQRGDQGSEVLQLQTALSEQGYFLGPFTGFYGSLTEQAVVEFQQNSAYLVTDGVAGANTQAALGMSRGTVNCSPGAVAVADTALRFGSTGAAVKQLQQDLADAGFYSSSGPFTEYFGELTEASVLDLQAAHGILQDGVVGAETRAALSRSLSQQQLGGTPSGSGTEILRFGATGPAVKQLQQDLIRAGVYDANDPITEFFGEKTEAAVKRLQAHYGLAQDGVVGPQTRTALSKAIAQGGIPRSGTGRTVRPPAAPERSVPEETERTEPRPAPTPDTTTQPRPTPTPSVNATLPLPTGFIRVKQNLQAFDQPEGQPIRYTIASGLVIGYLEDRKDGWIKIGVPTGKGSWIFAEEDYSNVEFINLTTTP
jgi:peptidoglycan hydrolase-like protein with peptidoglycan-binding domain